MISASLFLDKSVTFISLGLVLYGIASLYGWLSKDSIISHTVKCPYCRKSISEKVSSSQYFVVLTKC